MRRQRKLRKEDIGDPSNFVHVEHVGFGPKPATLVTQKSLDLDQENRPNEGRHGSLGIPENGEGSFEDSYPENDIKVERRVKGSRSSLIPRHHRSTTTCIFPESSNCDGGGGGGPYRQQHPNLANKMSVDSSKRGSDSGSTLKPTFGSLLNLSFLPLGLGKSSSKSPSISTNKTKRASLLNLTASHLFSGQKTNSEGKRDSVHMTGYTRRRSFSDENGDLNVNGTGAKPKPSNEPGKPPVPAASRIPLAKLGRSKSNMSEFNKRPKLRLKILPPPPPVPVPSPVIKSNTTPKNDSEELPSPPPTPLPSPPPSPPQTPKSAPPIEELTVVVKRIPNKSPPRPRIIPLPSTCSVDSMGNSPQYLTPAGGSSPLLAESNDEPVFPITSPTIPPASTPFFASSQHVDTPPVWPLQPTWPTSLSLSSPQIQPTIPEIPSPEKEEMEVTITDSEYDPVLSIVESIISESQSYNPNAEGDVTQEIQQEDMEVPNNVSDQTAITSTNVEQISEMVQRTILYQNWPKAATTIFASIPSSTAKETDTDDSSTRAKEIYGDVVSKTLEFWMEMMGDHATVDALAKIFEDAGLGDSAESIRNEIQLSGEGDPKDDQ